MTKKRRFRTPDRISGSAHDRYHKIRKALTKFYHRHPELIFKYNIGLKTFLQQGILELVFYVDLVYKLKRIVKKLNLSDESDRKPYALKKSWK